MGNKQSAAVQPLLVSNPRARFTKAEHEALAAAFQRVAVASSQGSSNVPPTGKDKDARPAEPSNPPAEPKKVLTFSRFVYRCCGPAMDRGMPRILAERLFLAFSICAIANSTAAGSAPTPSPQAPSSPLQAEITWEGFLAAVAVALRGTPSELARFLYVVYDVESGGSSLELWRSEVRKLLIQFYYDNRAVTVANSSSSSRGSGITAEIDLSLDEAFSLIAAQQDKGKEKERERDGGRSTEAINPQEFRALVMALLGVTPAGKAADDSIAAITPAFQRNLITAWLRPASILLFQPMGPFIVRHQHQHQMQSRGQFAIVTPPSHPLRTALLLPPAASASAAVSLYQSLIGLAARARLREDVVLRRWLETTVTLTMHATASGQHHGHHSSSFFHHHLALSSSFRFSTSTASLNRLMMMTGDQLSGAATTTATATAASGAGHSSPPQLLAVVSSQGGADEETKGVVAARSPEVDRPSASSSDKSSTSTAGSSGSSGRLRPFFEVSAVDSLYRRLKASAHSGIVDAEALYRCWRPLVPRQLCERLVLGVNRLAILMPASLLGAAATPAGAAGTTSATTGAASGTPSAGEQGAEPSSLQAIASRGNGMATKEASSFLSSSSADAGPGSSSSSTAPAVVSSVLSKRAFTLLCMIILGGREAPLVANDDRSSSLCVSLLSRLLFCCFDSDNDGYIALPSTATAGDPSASADFRTLVEFTRLYGSLAAGMRPLPISSSSGSSSSQCLLDTRSGALDERSLSSLAAEALSPAVVDALCSQAAEGIRLLLQEGKVVSGEDGNASDSRMDFRAFDRWVRQATVEGSHGKGGAGLSLFDPLACFDLVVAAIRVESAVRPLAPPPPSASSSGGAMAPSPALEAEVMLRTLQPFDHGDQDSSSYSNRQPQSGRPNEGNAAHGRTYSDSGDDDGSDDDEVGVAGKRAAPKGPHSCPHVLGEEWFVAPAQWFRRWCLWVLGYVSSPLALGPIDTTPLCIRIPSPASFPIQTNATLSPPSSLAPTPPAGAAGSTPSSSSSLVAAVIAPILKPEAQEDHGLLPWFIATAATKLSSSSPASRASLEALRSSADRNVASLARRAITSGQGASGAGGGAGGSNSSLPRSLAMELSRLEHELSIAPEGPPSSHAYDTALLPAGANHKGLALGGGQTGLTQTGGFSYSAGAGASGRNSYAGAGGMDSSQFVLLPRRAWLALRGWYGCKGHELKRFVTPLPPSASQLSSSTVARGGPQKPIAVGLELFPPWIRVAVLGKPPKDSNKSADTNGAGPSAGASKQGWLGRWFGGGGGGGDKPKTSARGTGKGDGSEDAAAGANLASLLPSQPPVLSALTAPNLSASAIVVVSTTTVESSTDALLAPSPPPGHTSVSLNSQPSNIFLFSRASTLGQVKETLCQAGAASFALRPDRTRLWLCSKELVKLAEAEAAGIDMGYSEPNRRSGDIDGHHQASSSSSTSSFSMRSLSLWPYIPLLFSSTVGGTYPPSTPLWSVQELGEAGDDGDGADILIDPQDMAGNSISSGGPLGSVSTQQWLSVVTGYAGVYYVHLRLAEGGPNAAAAAMAVASWAGGVQQKGAAAGSATASGAGKAGKGTYPMPWALGGSSTDIDMVRGSQGHLLPVDSLWPGAVLCLDDDASHHHNEREKQAQQDRALAQHHSHPSSVSSSTSGPLTLARFRHRPNAIVGLSNLGNTCYLSASLQCLINSPFLPLYFTASADPSQAEWCYDLNTTSALGTGGSLALAFADLLREVWTAQGRGAPANASGSGGSEALIAGERRTGAVTSLNTTSVAPRRLKHWLSEANPQFSGNDQHDSQEALNALLSFLAEDLNRVKKKPYAEQPDSNGRPDEVVAEEWWVNHTAREQSILSSLFTGQFKSTLTCDHCLHTSVRFEPFTILSLPLPLTKERHFTVTMVFPHPALKPLVATLSLPVNGTVRDLKKKAAEVMTAHLHAIEASLSGHGASFASPSSSAASSILPSPSPSDLPHNRPLASIMQLLSTPPLQGMISASEEVTMETVGGVATASPHDSAASLSALPQVLQPGVSPFFRAAPQPWDWLNFESPTDASAGEGKEEDGHAAADAHSSLNRAAVKPESLALVRSCGHCLAEAPSYTNDYDSATVSFDYDDNHPLSAFRDRDASAGLVVYAGLPPKDIESRSYHAGLMWLKDNSEGIKRFLEDKAAAAAKSAGVAGSANSNSNAAIDIALFMTPGTPVKAPRLSDIGKGLYNNGATRATPPHNATITAFREGARDVGAGAGGAGGEAPGSSLRSEDVDRTAQAILQKRRKIAEEARTTSTVARQHAVALKEKTERKITEARAAAEAVVAAAKAAEESAAATDKETSNETAALMVQAAAYDSDSDDIQAVRDNATKAEQTADRAEAFAAEAERSCAVEVVLEDARQELLKGSHAATSGRAGKRYVDLWYEGGFTAENVPTSDLVLRLPYIVTLQLCHRSVALVDGTSPFAIAAGSVGAGNTAGELSPLPKAAYLRILPEPASANAAFVPSPRPSPTAVAAAGMPSPSAVSSSAGTGTGAAAASVLPQPSYAGALPASSLLIPQALAAHVGSLSARGQPALEPALTSAVHALISPSAGPGFASPVGTAISALPSPTTVSSVGGFGDQLLPALPTPSAGSGSSSSSSSSSSAAFLFPGGMGGGDLTSAAEAAVSLLPVPTPVGAGSVVGYDAWSPPVFASAAANTTAAADAPAMMSSSLSAFTGGQVNGAPAQAPPQPALPPYFLSPLVPSLFGGPRLLRLPADTWTPAQLYQYVAHLSSSFIRRQLPMRDPVQLSEELVAAAADVSEAGSGASAAGAGSDAEALPPSPETTIWPVWGFCLRMVSSRGQNPGLNCSRCSWLKGCPGCVIEPLADRPFSRYRPMEGETIAVDWDPALLEDSLDRLSLVAKDVHPSVAAARELETKATTLGRCMDDFSKDELLDEPGFCSNCSKVKVKTTSKVKVKVEGGFEVEREVTKEEDDVIMRKRRKRIEIWRAPPILIVQLKRFHQTAAPAPAGGQQFQQPPARRKLHTLVNFPLTGFSLKPYMGASSLPSPKAVAASGTADQPAAPASSLPLPASSPPVLRSRAVSMNARPSEAFSGGIPCLLSRTKTTFDLYGVVCHEGLLGAGHYTAYCRSPYDGHFHHYNDKYVSDVPGATEEEVQREIVTPAAYLLFYARRDIMAGWHAALKKEDEALGRTVDDDTAVPVRFEEGAEDNSAAAEGIATASASVPSAGAGTAAAQDAADADFQQGQRSSLQGRRPMTPWELFPHKPSSTIPAEELTRLRAAMLSSSSSSSAKDKAAEALGIFDSLADKCAIM